MAVLLIIFSLFIFSAGYSDEFIENLMKELQERGETAWWWDKDWWKKGIIKNVENHEVVVEWVSYMNGDVEIPAMIARPKKEGKYPGVLFLHGRRGLDKYFQMHVVRLAARGLVVFAPDLYTGRFIPQFPIEHDYEIEEDANKGLDYLLSLPYLSSKKVCVYGLTRGGYYSLKVLVTKKRQKKDIVCFVGYYPHLQDPNAPEPMQVYRYAEEVEQLDIPILFFVGEKEQYQRLRPILMAVKYLKEKGKPVKLIIYPGVGRGFDFRNGDRRTFADDLAAKDAIIRASEFIKENIRKYSD